MHFQFLSSNIAVLERIILGETSADINTLGIGQGLILNKDREFFSTGSRTHPASYLVCTGGKALGA
jgi:hypothetical protein